MTSDARPLAVLTEESERQLQRLRRGLRRMEGFALYVVVARDLGRVELLRRLRAWSGAGGVPELFFFPEGEAGARAVDRFLAERDKEQAVAGAVIPEGDALLDVEEGNALSALNVARDVLYKVIRGPLLLVLSPEREGDLSQKAPDLFDVRAGTVAVEATAVEPGPVDVSAVAQLEAGSARTVAELQVEAARLRALAETEDPPFGALSDAWARLGGQFLEQGAAGEARGAAKTAQRLAEQNGYTNGVAEGMALEGQALEYTGKRDEAQAWYEKALAIYEQLGNRPGVACSYHALGILAHARGELDKAQVWHEKSLAIDEQLGDRSGMASSYSHLGLLAARRDDYAQAFDWTVRALAVFPDFPHPMTAPAPDTLASLTGAHGMPALEASWWRVTGQPLPAHVRSYVEDRIRAASPDEASR